MSRLPEASDKKTIPYSYFPTSWQAVVWRNWGYIPIDRIAKVLQTTEENIRQAASDMGLNPQVEVNLSWLKRGYLTIIRNNWMICSYEQIMTLLQISEEELAFILKEDDFMWIKLGEFKPKLEPPQYKPLTEEQKKKTIERFANVRMLKDNAFEFIDYYTKDTNKDERVKIGCTLELDNEQIRFIYPYFALYGDVLIDESIDPFPETLLEEYERVGINGVWMQGVLYQLVEFPFDKELSVGWEKRLETLRRLTARAKKYGIGIYLYLNEPRAMKPELFEKYPHLRGEQEEGFYAMCTSTKEVQDYLYQAMKTLFEQVPDLAGFFSITMSENLTNCYSIIDKEGAPDPTRKVTCPRCSKRGAWEVVAEVNNILARGAHAGNPNAKAIVWNWGWRNEWEVKALPLLTENQIIQCTSEKWLPFEIAGTKGRVGDYTMSLCGPSERTRGLWEAAQACGHEVSAKVQFNNTWEMSAVPFIPVFDKVAEHIRRLIDCGVRHLQVSWTLGGCPSPNLKLASRLMSGQGTTEEFLADYLGKEIGNVVNRAQKKMSEAFSEFPFHIDVLYFGPQNFGPMAPFFLADTGYKSTMVGFPYDDIKGWSGIYDCHTLKTQFEKLCREWSIGLEMLDGIKGSVKEADEIRLMSQACYCHFLSTYHHIAFVEAREKKEVEIMLEIIRKERQNVQTLITIRLQDSRIGYESSNHYFYTLQDLQEKLLNLAWCEETLCGK